ncbi:MAG: hypothetical protein N3A65_03215, partial [candidate division WOR-3 bacterium]|nr:hypothetical protein [candidate division WOR-3 bacterium]
MSKICKFPLKKVIPPFLFLPYLIWGIPELTDDVATTISNNTNFKYNQTAAYWAVVGVRSTSDWDIELYTDTLFNNLVAGSSGTDLVDFVVGDYNHSPLGWEGVKVYRYSGTASATVEYEDNTEVLSVGSNTGYTWPAGDVVEIWDVYLNPGSYTFTIDITSGTVDVGMALFASNGAAYYAGRYYAVASADAYGNGGDESFSYTISNTDWYGIVVWANNGNSGGFNIYISTGGGSPLVELTDDVATTISNNTNFKYNQTAAYW